MHPQKIVFVLENCQHCDELPKCKKGKLRMKRIKNITLEAQPDEITFLDPTKKGFTDKLRELDLPDVWMADFDREGNIIDAILPYGEHYFEIFADGIKRCVVIVAPPDEDDFDMMIS